jgi:hypothetical protein
VAARFHTEEIYLVSAQRLFDTLTDPDFLRVKALSRRGVLEARCQRVDEADGSRVLTLDLEEEPRLGRKNERSTLTIRWRPATFSSTWRQVQHNHGDRVRAEGKNTILPEGEGQCRYRVEGEIEIRLPLLGKSIEKRAATEIEKSRDHEYRYLCMHFGIPEQPRP